MSEEHIKNEITEAHLHAYVDGLLSQADASKVSDYLIQNPEKADEVADWAAQNKMLDNLFSHEEAELRTQDIDLSISVDRPAVFAKFLRVAAMIAIVVAGVASGWVARGTMPVQNVSLQVATVQNARAAHVLYTSEVLHPVDVGADQAAHLVDWLSSRLDTKLIAPDLSSSGFSLVGGRLLPSGDNPAAQFMYENGAGQRLTVYASPGNEEKLASFQFEKWDGFSSVYWRDQNLQYAIVGEMEREQLIAIATNVYRQLI